MRTASELLDEIPSETLYTLLYSLNSRRNVPGNDWISSRFPPGHVVELQGPPASGKSHFLYHLISLCILSETYELRRLGGMGKAVLLFDTDRSFDTLRFKHLMLSRIKSSIEPLGLPMHHADAIFNQSYPRLHVFHPLSSSQLAATLMHLPSYIATNLPDVFVGLIAIDSLSAFHWADRFTVEQRRASSKGPSHPSAYPLYNISVALESLRSSFSPLIVLTNWGLDTFPTTPQATAPRLYKQHLYPFPSLFAPDERNSSADRKSPTIVSPLRLSTHITFFPVRKDIVSGKYEPAMVSKTEVECLMHRLEEAPERFTLELAHASVEVTVNDGLGMAV